ncbi:MAG: S8 family serine peptidase [Actinobacteria bacterium]|nr:S8 family serine peptidase [Actinomycetota bacterium]
MGSPTRSAASVCLLVAATTVLGLISLQPAHARHAFIASRPGPAPMIAPENTGATTVRLPEVDEQVGVQVRDQGRTRVIVRLSTPVTGDDFSRSEQSAAAAGNLLRTLPSGSYEQITNPETVPVIILAVDSSAVDALSKSSLVASVESDVVVRPSSLNSTTVLGVQRAVASGWDGTGQTIAVVDSGVQSSHALLMRGATPKTIAEACFSSNTTTIRSSCIGGTPMAVNAVPSRGSAQPCDLAVSVACGHGTAVAGVAVGGDGTGTVSGVAPAASLISVKIFGHDVADPSAIGASLSDVNTALQWLYNRRADFPGLVAVNLSLGGGKMTTDCGSGSTQAYIHQLLLVGIATVVAAGNDGFNDAVSVPACAPDAIAVGSIDDTTAARSPWSNVSPKVALYAPGTSIASANAATGARSNFSGTSLAAPAVTGAWAVVHQRFPDMTGADILDQLRSRGTTITTDTASPVARYQIPLIRVDLAMRSPVGSESQPPDVLTAVTPARLMDTRAEPTIDSLYTNTGPLTGGETRRLRVTGRGYIPANDAASVSVNVTVADPTTAGFVTVFGGGASRPTASNLNFTPGEVTANLVMVPVGADGTISIYNFTGLSHVIVDVLGWFPSAGAFRPINPARVMDTRDAPTVDGRSRNTGPFGPGESRSLVIAGRGGVPASGVAAVALNVTAVNSTAAGYLTVYPSGSTRPTASNLNFGVAEVVPNMVISPLDSLGRAQLFNFDGRTDIVVDVLGWFPRTPSFTALVAARLLDTRGGPTIDGIWSGGGPILGGTHLDLKVTGRAGVPSTGVAAVVLNLTVTEPTANGFLTVYPAGILRPRTSSINFTSGQTLANLVIALVGVDGRISLYNLQGATPTIVDVVGWFG